MDIKSLSLADVKSLKFACLKALEAFFKHKNECFDCIEYFNDKTLVILKEKFNIKTSSVLTICDCIDEIYDKENTDIEDIEDYVKTLFDLVINNTFRIMSNSEKISNLENFLWVEIMDDYVSKLLSGVFGASRPVHMLIEKDGNDFPQNDYKMNFMVSSNNTKYGLIFF